MIRPAASLISAVAACSCVVIGVAEEKSADEAKQEAKSAAKDGKCYELRVYYAAEGKLDALNDRFREHTTKLFEKHGMTNIGYWVPLDNPENKLVFVLAYPSKEAREKSWAAFMADPEWQEAQRTSEKDGKLVAKVDSVLLEATAYSPEIQPAAEKRERVFELRTYTAAEGKLAKLHERFTNHTIKLFSKHGMTHFGYWTPRKDEKGAENTLIYLLAHESKEACEKSFAEFRKDPDWIAAKGASERDGSLTAKNGVKSELLRPTDYSPTR